MRAFFPKKRLIDQLVVKSKSSRVLNFQEMRFSGFFQPARSETHTQTEYHSLQLPGDNALDVTYLSVSGFQQGTYNCFVNKKLVGRDLSEQELEQFIINTLASNNNRPSF